MSNKILISVSTFAEADPAPMEILQKNNFDIIMNPYKRKINSDELLRLLPGVTGLIAGLEDLSRSVLEHSDLRVISRCGAGMSNVDLEACRKKGIRVFNTPDAPTNAVAEIVIGAMISLIRRLPWMNQELHNGKWSKKIGLQIENSTVTIIGFGRIGRRVAQLLKPFNPKIIAVDPFHEKFAEGTTFLSLEDALPQSDIITIHASGNEVILGEKEFSLIKKGAYLLNCSRGSVIDEHRLMFAIDNLQISGAWLDCFWDEPYRGRLIKYPQVLLTPHIGSYTGLCRRRMELEAVNNLIAGFNQK